MTAASKPTPNTNELKTYVPDAGKSILIVGDSGTHKTWFLGTCPDPYVFDFDKGLAILRGRTFGYDTFKDAPFGSRLTDPKQGIYPWGTAWVEFIKRLNDIGAMVEGGKCPYKTLGLDSGTMMSSIAMNYVLKENNRTPKEGPRIQDWGAQIGLIETVMDQLTAWTSFIKVVTCHVQRDKNEITGNIEKLPLLTGKLAGKIGIYFDEVWFADVDTAVDDPEKRNFTLRTISDGTFRQAKSRFGVPNKTPTHWEKVAPFIMGPGSPRAA